MGIGSHRYPDILRRMPHQISQMNRIHTCFCLFRTVGMPAYMQRDIRHRVTVDFIEFLPGMLEIMFPAQGKHRMSVLIQAEKTPHTVHFWFDSRSNPPIQNCPECFLHHRLHGNDPCPTLRFRLIFNIDPSADPLKLFADKYCSLIHIQVFNR